MRSLDPQLTSSTPQLRRPATQAPTRRCSIIGLRHRCLRPRHVITVVRSHAMWQMEYLATAMAGPEALVAEQKQTASAPARRDSLAASGADVSPWPGRERKAVARRAKVLHHPPRRQARRRRARQSRGMKTDALLLHLAVDQLSLVSELRLGAALLCPKPRVHASTIRNNIASPLNDSIAFGSRRRQRLAMTTATAN